MRENYLIKNKKHILILIQNHMSNLNQYPINTRIQNLIVEQTSAQIWGIDKLKKIKLEKKLKSK